MRFCLSIKTALVIATLSLAACNSLDGSSNQAAGGRAQATPPATAAAPPDDGVRRITIPELQSALEKGEAVVIDVRGSVEYKLGHIKGARLVPLGLIAEQKRELPRDKLIVTYCA
jgi:3-mercaptopyruvate sulfurtransferase SseA